MREVAGVLFIVFMVCLIQPTAVKNAVKEIRSAFIEEKHDQP